ncbi:hypothetical protein IAD21_02902 [Abditibacteriota bacterium]|nr:hypothetical protein IAD21_02902 [Abditibacteriota bacterium]
MGDNQIYPPDITISLKNLFDMTKELTYLRARPPNLGNFASFGWSNLLVMREMDEAAPF